MGGNVSGLAWGFFCNSGYNLAAPYRCFTKRTLLEKLDQLNLLCNFFWQIFMVFVLPRLMYFLFKTDPRTSIATSCPSIVGSQHGIESNGWAGHTVICFTRKGSYQLHRDITHSAVSW